MDPEANDGLIVNASSEGGDGEGAGGGGGVGFTGNLWKDMSGGDAMGTKRFAGFLAVHICSALLCQKAVDRRLTLAFDTCSSWTICRDVHKCRVLGCLLCIA